MIKRLIVIGVLLLCVSCVNQQAVSALRDGIAVNQGHMSDKALPTEAHAVAQDNYDFMWQTLNYLDDSALPPEVKARMDARRGTTPPPATPAGDGK